MGRFVILVCMLSALTFTGGCAALVIGAGAGAGVYTYVKGELTRTYAADFDHTQAAVMQSLDYLKIPVDEKNQDSGATLIKAHQKDGSPVTVTIRTIRYDLTEVAVRCGRVGFWDRENAELIHATILNTI